MRTYIKKYIIGVSVVVGCFSCAPFDVIDSDLQAILLNSKQKKHVRASLDRSYAPAAKAPPVKDFDKKKNNSDLILRDSPEVKKYLSLYTKSRRKDVEVPLELREEHLPVIETVLDYYDLPPELSNLAFVESKFNQTATSPRGAKGIWQLMKPTAEGLGLTCRFWNDERKDVLRSSIAAARYIKELKEKFGDWLLVIAAYNAGPARVEAAQLRAGKNTDFFSLARRGLLPRETVAHVSKFIALTMITRSPGLYGFDISSKSLVGDQALVE